jgi:hypothetical protein
LPFHSNTFPGSFPREAQHPRKALLSPGSPATISLQSGT